MSLLWHEENPPPLPRPQQAQAGENGGHGLRIQGTPASDSAMRCTKAAMSLTTGTTKASGRSTMSNTARRSVGDGVGMNRRMQHRRVRITYWPAASVAMREDELLAHEWGCKPCSAHQRKLRLPIDLGTVIQVRRLLGAHESLASYLAPVEAAQSAAPQPDAIHREAMTDPQEDVLQELYRVDPCEHTARALVRFRAVMRQASLDADREIAARWGLSL